MQSSISSGCSGDVEVEDDENRGGVRGDDDD